MAARTNVPSSVFDSHEALGLFSFICQDLEGGLLGPAAPDTGLAAFFFPFPPASPGRSPTRDICAIISSLLSPKEGVLASWRTDMTLIDAPQNLYG